MQEAIAMAHGDDDAEMMARVMAAALQGAGTGGQVENGPTGADFAGD